MAPGEIRGPNLEGVAADANRAELPFVVIGGFAVIAHGYARATKDSDLLVPDGPEADAAIARFLELAKARRLSDRKHLSADEIRIAHHLRLDSRHGVVDILRGGLPPLDFETVSAYSIHARWRGEAIRVAGLRSLVGFKRLANRTQDRADLEALERANGELPIDPIPGLDD